MPGKINTPLGTGKIVYKLPDGTYLVVFDHGGGKIFFAEEIWPELASPPLRSYDPGRKQSLIQAA